MNVLIVDDIPRVVESVKNGIEWKKLGINEVFCANSADEAQDIMERRNINILLCDIEMPYRSGFDLLRWCRNQKMEIECIFLTSHADFEYAREALSLGGFDYILLPSSFEIIHKTIKKAIFRLDAKYNLLKKAELLQENQSAFIKSVSIHAVKEGNADLFRSNLEKIGCIPQGRKDIHIVAVRNNAKLILRDILLSKNVKNNDFSMVECGDDYNFAFLFTHLNHTYEIKETISSYKDIFWVGTFIDFMTNLAVREILFGANMEKGVEIARESGEQTKIVLKVEEYIKENIDKDIKCPDVAKSMFMNPDYLSRVVKRQTGYSLSSFIAKTRVDYAALLMEQTNIPISFIASKVGFDNFSYFSQVFKRFKEQSPSEYRQKRG